MEGLARPREGQGFAWTRALTGVALLFTCALTACAACAGGVARAAAPSASSGYSVERVCGSPRPLAAVCTALRDVPVGDADAPSPAVDMTSPPPFLTPAQLHAAYALPTGTKVSAKQTVAVIDAFDDPTAEPDLGVYDEQFGLPACTAANGCFRKINQEGKASPLPPERGEWAGEISIDVQMVHAICDSCHILLVEAESEALSDLGAAVNAAVAAGATEVSNSYVSPEEPATASLYEELRESFYEHPGVVLTAASGDCGYLNSACPEEPATANFPADVPEVVAVGGTSLREQDGAWTSTVWEDSGSGCSELFAAPVWQRAVANFAATGCGERRSVADVAVVGDPKTGVDIYDSTPEGDGQPTGWTAFGGTSVSAPIVAAEFALAGGAQHVTHPPATLYAHAGEAEDFYDVVSGANGSCGSATSCQAVAGFDGPSGLGSPLGLGAFAPPEAPTITGFTPSSGITGASVTIEGTGLGAVTGVAFGSLAAKFTILSSSQIEAVVPDGARKGKITLTTPTASVTSNRGFSPTLSITSFSPQRGAPGTRVTIDGVGFNARSRVSFDGTEARVDWVHPRRLRAIVPAEAGAGPISVTNTSGTLGTVYSAGSFTP